MRWVVALLCTLSVTVLAQSVQQPAAPQPAVQQPPVPQPPDPDSRPSFAEWLNGVRTEAITRGIRQEIVDQALTGIDEPVPVVIERDRSQAETVLSIETYLDRQLTAKRIATGREMFAKYRPALDRVSDTYGVPARIVAGIWGMESNFGQFSGVRPTVAALATLAWDPRRSTMFRRELFDALEILNRGDIDVAHMKGSWAGAMGQPQFMPSSFLEFAEDFDGDGRRDIWSTPEDVFASIANYLKGHGWAAGQTWGREVSVADEAAGRIAGSVAHRTGGCQATRDMTVPLSLSEWRRMGVRTLGGAALPAGDEQAAMVAGARRRFLVYANYDALLQYNCAQSYALSVALLGDRLASPAAVSARPAPAPPVKKHTPAHKH